MASKKVTKRNRKPAKAKKAKATGKAAGEVKRPTHRIASEALIRETYALHKRHSGRITDMSWELGSILRNAQECGLNLQPFKDICRMKKMEPVKLRAYWDDLMYYAKVLNLRDGMAKDLFKDHGKRRPQPQQQGNGANVLTPPVPESQDKVDYHGGETTGL